MTQKIQPLSKQTLLALETFGLLIRAVRIERRMSQAELAERIGVARQTIANIEKGNAKVAIGTTFEVAILLGIPLFHSDSEEELTHVSQNLRYIAKLLPNSAPHNKVTLDDDF